MGWGASWISGARKPDTLNFFFYSVCLFETLLAIICFSHKTYFYLTFNLLNNNCISLILWKFWIFQKANFEIEILLFFVFLLKKFKLRMWRGVCFSIIKGIISCMCVFPPLSFFFSMIQSSDVGADNFSKIFFPVSVIDPLICN